MNRLPQIKQIQQRKNFPGSTALKMSYEGNHVSSTHTGLREASYRNVKVISQLDIGLRYWDFQDCSVTWQVVASSWYFILVLICITNVLRPFSMLLFNAINKGHPEACAFRIRSLHRPTMPDTQYLAQGLIIYEKIMTFEARV